ncbi:MAG: 3-deoxy-7-phosphoheptulonate synthase [Bdellovibrionales bacterium]|nr:3-deoxy-7-phosphoheptulonate synthase [Bdellovibrionales bacterium]
MKHKFNVVKVGSTTVGGGPFSVWAGPCSVESQEQFSLTARKVKEQGGAGLRGGLYKLRTDPRAFQGLGREAFEFVRAVKKDVGLPFVSEITDARQIGDFLDVVDAFQVGSRNMHNYALLKELSQIDKPILLKRGFAATFKEWMLAVDYLAKGGNEKIILCERGIRTFETATRNTFDINAIALTKQETPFPILADPSHGTGIAALVTPIALAAAAAGADGLLVEVHPNPPEAKSDGYQSLNFAQFEDLMHKLPKVLTALDRKMATV